MKLKQRTADDMPLNEWFLDGDGKQRMVALNPDGNKVVLACVYIHPKQVTVQEPKNIQDNRSAADLGEGEYFIDVTDRLCQVVRDASSSSIKRVLVFGDGSPAWIRNAPAHFSYVKRVVSPSELEIS